MNMGINLKQSINLLCLRILEFMKVCFIVINTVRISPYTSASAWSQIINYVDEKNKDTHRHYTIRVLVYRSSISAIEIQPLADCPEKVHNSFKELWVFRNWLLEVKLWIGWCSGSSCTCMINLIPLQTSAGIVGFEETNISITLKNPSNRSINLDILEV